MIDRTIVQRAFHGIANAPAGSDWPIVEASIRKLMTTEEFQRLTDATLADVLGAVTVNDLIYLARTVKE
jgi:hypothetical protein